MSLEDNASSMTKSLQNKNDQFINILLLGETGVGKSTFINSLVNYLTYPDFELAKNSDLITLISSQFTIQDQYGDYHEITVGPSDDQNECLDTGMSATQDVKSYVFPIWNGTIKIRLIDTPGIGDGRGIDQDNLNCEKILSYIGQLDELHAICYVFKPTNARITVYFEYCMTQILSRLDKSASRNMIFIFTNARGTDYTPGDTYPILKKVVNTIKARPPYVDIPFNRNVFCFDNEAFRYLAAIKQNIEFSTRTTTRNYESWSWSVQQCNGLITYITGDSENSPLQPHSIKSTNAINEARRLIVQLSRPLAEISQLISDNVFALQRHKEDLDMGSNTIDELKKKLYMPVIDLEVTQLPKPVTICTSKKCSEIYKVGELSKYHYKQRCHDPCYLRNVPKEIIGSPELINCAAMNRSTGKCIACSCDFSTHMHIYYLTKTVENKVIDENIQKNINNKESLLKNSRKLMTDISTRKDELDEEHKTITKTCAKFAHFLQNNAITPFSDAYKEYIEYLITREKSLGELAKKVVIEHLERTLREYQEAKQFFDDALALQKKIGKTDLLITPQNIQENIQALYKLKHNGKKIKELYECQTNSRIREHKYKEYVHKVLSFFKMNPKKEKKITNKPAKCQKQKDAWQVQRKRSNKSSSVDKKLFLADQTCLQKLEHQRYSMKCPPDNEPQSSLQNLSDLKNDCHQYNDPQSYSQQVAELDLQDKVILTQPECQTEKNSKCVSTDQTSTKEEFFPTDLDSSQDPEREGNSAE